MLIEAIQKNDQDKMTAATLVGLYSIGKVSEN